MNMVVNATALWQIAMRVCEVLSSEAHMVGDLLMAAHHKLEFNITIGMIVVMVKQ